jgi:hypothetical protein
MELTKRSFYAGRGGTTQESYRRLTHTTRFAPHHSPYASGDEDKLVHIKLVPIKRTAQVLPPHPGPPRSPR